MHKSEKAVNMKYTRRYHINLATIATTRHNCSCHNQQQLRQSNVIGLHNAHGAHRDKGLIAIPTPYN